jgi:hypothetical protein
MRMQGRQNIRGVVLSACIVFGVCTVVFSGETSAPAISVADFETGLPQGVVGQHARLSVTQENAAGGKACLQAVSDGGDKKAVIRLPLSGGTNLAQARALAAAVRVTGAQEPVALRWYGLDAANYAVWQRRFTVKPGDGWARLEFPLALWRWGNSRIGDWSDVRALGLQVESRFGELWLDDVRLLTGSRGEANALPDSDWLTKLAFPGRTVRSHTADGCLVATDAPDALSDDNLKLFAANMSRTRAWTKRVFGEAARPVLKGQPVALLIFTTRAEWLAFYERLGKEWDAVIPPPQSGGYTVQDIAASTFDPKQGVRPVFLHEGAHAIFSRDLRLLTGVPEHSWMQEALANYLQLCVYPQSARRSDYVKNFAAGVAGDSFFRPLSELMGKPVTTKHYLQLASLAAFLIEEKPEWLRGITAGLQENKPIEAILKDCGTDTAALEKAWLEWGRKRFATGAGAEQTEIFAAPEEWRTTGG